MKLVKLQFPSPLIHYNSSFRLLAPSIIHKIRSFTKNSDQILYLFGTQRSLHDSMPFADSVSSLTIIVRKIFKCAVGKSSNSLFFLNKDILVVSFSFCSLLGIFAIQDVFKTSQFSSFFKAENSSPSITESKITLHICMYSQIMNFFERAY